MTDAMIEILQSDAIYSSKVEAVSAIERGCQYMYSGDPAKLLRYHTGTLGIKYSPFPYIPADVIRFEDENVIISDTVSSAVTWMTSFNTAPMLKHYNVEFFKSLVENQAIEAIILNWIPVLEVQL